jgi:DNA-binding CsgD family transcriptional regulator
MVHVFRTCKNLLKELENPPHVTTGNPEDADS